MKSLLLGMGATFFQAFDVPVFWPILLIYWFVLFTVTMKRQIKHMIKYRYVPFSFGKKVRVLCLHCLGWQHCSCNHHRSIPRARRASEQQHWLG